MPADSDCTLPSQKTKLTIPPECQLPKLRLYVSVGPRASPKPGPAARLIVSGQSPLRIAPSPLLSMEIPNSCGGTCFSPARIVLDVPSLIDLRLVLLFQLSLPRDVSATVMAPLDSNRRQ